jgi:hypothetical protein
LVVFLHKTAAETKINERPQNTTRFHYLFLQSATMHKNVGRCEPKTLNYTFHSPHVARIP